MHSLDSSNGILYGDQNKRGNIFEPLKHDIEWKKQSQTQRNTMIFHLSWFKIWQNESKGRYKDGLWGAGNDSGPAFVREFVIFIELYHVWFVYFSACTLHFKEK